MKTSGVLFLALFLGSCIPISIKPEIIDYSITNGAKFKRGLPNQTVFVFEDPEDTEEFYTYIKVKFNRQYQDVGYHIPVEVYDTAFYVTFCETERTTKTINLILITADVALQAADIAGGDLYR
jgi:hypothetical protein